VDGAKPYPYHRRVPHTRLAAALTPPLHSWTGDNQVVTESNANGQVQDIENSLSPEQQEQVREQEIVQPRQATLTLPQTLPLSS